MESKFLCTKERKEERRAEEENVHITRITHGEEEEEGKGGGTSPLTAFWRGEDQRTDRGADDGRRCSSFLQLPSPFSPTLSSPPPAFLQFGLGVREGNGEEKEIECRRRSWKERRKKKKREN